MRANFPRGRTPAAGDGLNLRQLRATSELPSLNANTVPAVRKFLLRAIDKRLWILTVVLFATFTALTGRVTGEQ